MPCEPVLADRIVHAPRDHVRRLRHERAQIRPVDAPALVHVHEIGVARRVRHAERAARDGPDFDNALEPARERRAAPRDEHLLDARAFEPADQELRLPLTAAIATRDVDVGDCERHRYRAPARRCARSVAQRARPPAADGFAARDPSA